MRLISQKDTAASQTEMPQWTFERLKFDIVLQNKKKQIIRPCEREEKTEPKQTCPLVGCICPLNGCFQRLWSFIIKRRWRRLVFWRNARYTLSRFFHCAKNRCSGRWHPQDVCSGGTYTKGRILPIHKSLGRRSV